MRLAAVALVVLATQTAPGAPAIRRPAGDAPASITILAEDERTGAPLEGVVITLTGAALPKRTITARTFDNGAVRFNALPPGSYIVDVAPARTLLAPWGFASGGDTRSLVLATGESPVLRFKFRKAAVVTGQVLTPEGKPIRAATVEVVTSGSRPRGGPWVAVVSGPGAATDGEGRFVLRGLPPDRYLVRAWLTAEEGLLNFVYAPGTTSLAEATPVSLESGDEVAIGITARAVPAVSIRGVVLDNLGEPVKGAVVALRALQSHLANVGDGLTAERWLNSNAPATLRSDAAGRFVVGSVLQGVYALQVAALSPGLQPSIVGAGTLEVDVRTTNVDDLTVRLVPPARITGRLLFNGEEVPDPARSQIGMRPEGADAILRNGLASWSGWRADGIFEVAGILGLNRLTHRSSGGWFVERATLEDGTDIANAPFAFAPGKVYANVRVWLSDRTAEIKGALPDDWDTRPPSGIVVFPDDASLWADTRYVKQASVARDKRRFTVNALPPGRGYLVAAYPFPARQIEASGPASVSAELLEQLTPEATHLFLAEPGLFEVTLPGLRPR